MSNWVKKARNESGLSPEDCASAIGVSRNTYLSRENNPGTLNLNELRALKNAFSDSGQFLLWGAVEELKPKNFT